MPDQPNACMMPAMQEIRECRTPGPLGYNDRADPNWLWGNDTADRCYSPGPLGINDYASPLPFSQWLSASQDKGTAGGAPAPTQAPASTAPSGGGPRTVGKGPGTLAAVG